MTDVTEKPVERDDCHHRPQPAAERGIGMVLLQALVWVAVLVGVVLLVWLSFDFLRTNAVLPWLNGRDHRRLQTMRDYLRIAFDRVPIAADTRDRITRTAQKAISLQLAGDSTTTSTQYPSNSG